MSDFMQEYDEPDRRQRQKHPVRVTIVVMLSIVLVGAVVAGLFVANLANTFNSTTQTIETAFPAESTRPEKPAEAGDAVNILLMGSDSRGEGNADTTAGARSDTLMLMHIPGDRKNIQVMSIMRDTWVDIPGHGPSKINAAMALGGVPLMVQTVEGLFEVPIDHVTIIDFEGFKALTNALDGVKVDNPQAFQSAGSEGEAFPAGPQVLDGESALKFVRERKAFSDGDYTRVQNQQLFIKAIMSKFLTAETLTNPVRVNNVVSEMSPYLTVSDSFGAVAAGKLAFSLKNVRTSNVDFFTLPTQGIGTSADGQSIVLLDEAAVNAVSDALKKDTLHQYVEELEQDNQ
ncbi:LCP family protein [Arthrobacter roseus]|uniref:LCP family protein n=1 Tax=Arthrobacter roseus TaxID=136274 RepID=UPI001EF761D9|nr:LCP family protein [Arthrobacter roseus]MBM7848896.1 LCP family protein required for cell wall assembly [Arthrobacter roseus]